MKLKISDLFDPAAEIKASGEALPCSPAEIRELTLEKLHAQKTTRRGRILRLTGRGLLIAAVLACLMTATAVAAGLSIHQRRQEELREELNISDYRLGSYMEFPVSQETELPEEPSVTVLSAINDGSRQIVFLDLCPVSIQELNHLRAQAENRSGATVARTNSLELYLTAEDGKEYFCGGGYPFCREDGRPMYDYETHTLTCSVTIGTDRFRAPGSAVRIRLAMLDKTHRPVRDYGSVEISWTESVERRIFFDEPVAFQTPDTGEEGRIVGVELGSASFAWLIELPAEALQMLYPAYGQLQSDEDWDARSRAINSWLNPLLFDYLRESGVTLSDGRWFGGPWHEGMEPWIFSNTDGTYLKIGYSSTKPVMNPEEAVSTTIRGVTIPLA